MIRATDKRMGRIWVGLSTLLIAVIMLTGCWVWRMHSQPSRNAGPRGSYTTKDFGGYLYPKSSRTSASAKGHANDLLEAAADAYEKGQYLQAEADAQKIINKAKGAHPGTTIFHKALLAQQVAAYSAARRKDFVLASKRFAEQRDAASELPDHGKQPAEPGENVPTLEEEAAYQHAVCTGVLQGQKAAEAEYIRFLRRYPQSLLISGVIQRIARYHKGTIPKPAEKLWRQAMQIQKVIDQRQKREASLCGPECLAELLRRQGHKADVHALAEAMGTNEDGTSLAGLAKVAKRYGYSPRGLLLTERGLMQQKLPVIAFAQWGHYVIVEAITSKSVQVWDPDASGLHHPGNKNYSQQEWQQVWAGNTLALN